MIKNLKNRVVGEANYMINTKDLSERLKEIDKKLFNNVNDILQDHLENRHIRGGEVTKEKYAKRKED